MTRYPSIYGGTETVLGTFSVESVQSQFAQFIPGWTMPAVHHDGKVLDFHRDDNTEIVGFATRRPGEIRLHIINR